jgi:thymidylate kinase
MIFFIESVFVFSIAIISKNDTLPIESRKKIIDSYEFSFTQNPHRVKTIDAELDQDQVWNQIYAHVEKLFYV